MGICLDGLRDTKSQDSRSVGRDLNSGCVECEAALQSSASKACSV